MRNKIVCYNLQFTTHTIDSYNRYLGIKLFMPSNKWWTCDNFVTNLFQSIKNVVRLGAELHSPTSLVSVVRRWTRLKLWQQNKIKCSYMSKLWSALTHNLKFLYSCKHNLFSNKINPNLTLIGLTDINCHHNQLYICSYFFCY